MFILGINSAYHESSACLLKDEAIVAAVEEERFTRKKHAKMSAIYNPHELPINAIHYCLASAQVGLEEIDAIGFSINPEKRLENKYFNDHVTPEGWGSRYGEDTFYKHLCSIPVKLEAMGFRGDFRWIDHHICHAASAFYPSSFSEAAILTVDGIGEITSTLFATGVEQQLAVLQDIMYPNSLGFLWEKITKFLGFTEYDAYKVMGLAAYGKPDHYREQFHTIIKKTSEGNFTVDNALLCFRVEDYSELEKLFGTPRRTSSNEIMEVHQDIAAALQETTNEVLLHMVEHLYQQTRSKNLCLAGGVALNCISNEFIHTQGPFTNLYIQPAAHDAGTALGAALVVWHMSMGNKQRSYMEHVYLGPSFSEESVIEALQEKPFSYQKVACIEEVTASLLAQGKIVGWFQGAMEFGPRALGNRSLLATPTDHSIRSKLNTMIKHREDFRPLAPSVLYEAAQEWFTISKPTIASDFMLLTYPVKEHLKERIPAVVHADGTSRIQTVRQEINPRYHKLIAEFARRTGVPILLNTSFNDSEPIVCTPQDAIATFLRTPQIDYLVIGDFLIQRCAG